MATRNQNRFKKRQKEMERIRKAKEKMARRQGKKEKKGEADMGDIQDQPSGDEGSTMAS